ncbi:hypothetical protein ACFL04_02350 [Patescibacteria group bacterium]
MRKKIEPTREVTRAWQTGKAMLKEAGANFFINGAQVLDIAERKLKAAKWRRAEEDSRILFLEAVIRYHGPDTIVEIVAGEFTLFKPSKPPVPPS